MSERYRILWIDMSVSRLQAEQQERFEDFFDVYHYADLNSLGREIDRVRPDVLCFDFDFPTKAGLKTLQTTKRLNPKLPILMLTVQHSEALAVWAFRSRAWDYLVKPTSDTELKACLRRLTEMLDLRDLERTARFAALPSSVIPEENRWSGTRASSSLTLAPAIEFIERNYSQSIASHEVAELCHLTTHQLSRMFKEVYGITFQEYVMRLRIREASRLLQNPRASVTDVAFTVGFNDPSYFGKMFRRYLNCSPSQFQVEGNFVNALLAAEPAHGRERKQPLQVFPDEDESKAG